MDGLESKSKEQEVRAQFGLNQVEQPFCQISILAHCTEAYTFTDMHKSSSTHKAYMRAEMLSNASLPNANPAPLTASVQPKVAHIV